MKIDTLKLRLIAISFRDLWRQLMKPLAWVVIWLYVNNNPYIITKCSKRFKSE